jgi:hypothetical protein
MLKVFFYSIILNLHLQSVNKYLSIEYKDLSIKYLFRADIKYRMSLTNSAIDIGKTLNVFILI